MNTKLLSVTLRFKAEALEKPYEVTDGPLPLTKENAKDYAELLRCLARMIEGKTIAKAFGAPGDWGYSHPIGKAMAEAPAEPAKES